MEDPLKRLARLDCCAVSDAMDRLGVKNQVASGLAQRSTTRRIVGRAVTYCVMPVEHAPPVREIAPPRHLGTAAIESAQAGDVIVVEQRSGVEAGCWGGILTLGARLRGIAGVVADGFVRDIDEARAYDFPIYCRALTARTARGRVVEAGTNVPVTIAGVQVHPADLVIADASGIAFIPAADIARVLDMAEVIAAREAAMAKALLAGQPVSEVMGANYEHMLRPEPGNRELQK